MPSLGETATTVWILFSTCCVELLKNIKPNMGIKTTRMHQPSMSLNERWLRTLTTKKPLEVSFRGRGWAMMLCKSWMKTRPRSRWTKIYRSNFIIIIEWWVTNSLLLCRGSTNVIQILLRAVGDVVSLTSHQRSLSSYPRDWDARCSLGVWDV